MAANTLMISKNGEQALAQHEGVISGLYDDVSGYATYGVGHLVHQADKWKSLLLDSARADGVCEASVKKNPEGPYLDRGVTASPGWAELQARARTRALDTIAQAKFKTSYQNLSASDQQSVEAATDAAIAREVQLLEQSVDDVFAKDLAPMVTSINHAVTGVSLLQDELDALVSFVFNVGPSFQSSTLLKKINENRYRAGAAADRETAIAEIEAAFLMWNKSGGRVVAGLTKRRQDEADQFLRQARAELNTQKQAAAAGSGTVTPTA